MELYCKVCDERITLRNITRERNIGGGSLRCCNQCGKSEQDRLKEKYYVETYNKGCRRRVKNKRMYWYGIGQAL